MGSSKIRLVVGPNPEHPRHAAAWTNFVRAFGLGPLRPKRLLVLVRPTRAGALNKSSYWHVDRVRMLPEDTPARGLIVATDDRGWDDKVLGTYVATPAVSEAQRAKGWYTCAPVYGAQDEFGLVPQEPAPISPKVPKTQVEPARKPTRRLLEF